jgi:hypothetical protein
MDENPGGAHPRQNSCYPERVRACARVSNCGASKPRNLKNKMKKRYTVELLDEWTADLPVSVNGMRILFSQAYATKFRDETGCLTSGGLDDMEREAIIEYERLTVEAGSMFHPARREE